MIGFCGTCEREWTGLSEAHCASCCEHFTSDAAFDRHLATVVSDEDCCDPRKLRYKEGHGKAGQLVFESIQRRSGRAWRIRRDTPHPFASDSPSLPYGVRTARLVSDTRGTL